MAHSTSGSRGLTRHSRITAFVDILGWGSITTGVDSLALRRLASKDDLSPEDNEKISRLHSDTAIATRLDSAARQILIDLEPLAVPEKNISGAADAREFWENRHNTFIRSSDNIFIHGTSFRVVAAFVSELLRRGLDHGILFRAGISCGLVYHSEPPGPERLDPRSRSISIFGDGITSAVYSERAGTGRGVRAFIHSRLLSLLKEDDTAVLRAISTDKVDVHTAELRWWCDFAEIWPNTKLTEFCSSPIDQWISDTVYRLENDEMFDWNRKSEHGRIRLQDTKHLLLEVLNSGPT